MSRPATLPLDEALLTAAECAARVKCGVSSWWKIAKESRILRAGRVERGNRTFWLRSKVVEFLHFGLTESAVAAPSVSP